MNVQTLLELISDLRDEADASAFIQVPPHFGLSAGEIRRKCKGKDPNLNVTRVLVSDGARVDLRFYELAQAAAF